MKYRISSSAHWNTLPSDVYNKRNEVVYSVSERRFLTENFHTSVPYEVPSKPAYLEVTPEDWLEFQGWHYMAKTCSCRGGAKVKKNIWQAPKTIM